MTDVSIVVGTRGSATVEIRLARRFHETNIRTLSDGFDGQQRHGSADRVVSVEAADDLSAAALDEREQVVGHGRDDVHLHTAVRLKLHVSFEVWRGRRSSPGQVLLARVEKPGINLLLCGSARRLLLFERLNFSQRAGRNPRIARPRDDDRQKAKH